MTPDWLEAISAAATAIVWPIAIGIAIYMVRGTIAKAIAEGREFTISIAGTEISIGQAAEQQANYIDDLIEKVSMLEDRVAAFGGGAEVAKAEANLSGKRVLWVDDNPANNFQLAMTLRRLGVIVETKQSTSDAVEAIKDKKYDAIVSDMKRPEGGKAGIDLAKKVRAEQGYDEVPYFIFCGGWAAKNLARESAAAGVTAITSSGTTLLTDIRMELN